mmetsp:Transcript_32929/g.48290  ORF Transcript_32929/g.48290 Transcript_32929/m.48290 type:complete len:200 (-) Transcript_32929:883-1482(-)
MWKKKLSGIAPHFRNVRPKSRRKSTTADASSKNTSRTHLGRLRPLGLTNSWHPPSKASRRPIFRRECRVWFTLTSARRRKNALSRLSFRRLKNNVNCSARKEMTPSTQRFEPDILHGHASYSRRLWWRREPTLLRGRTLPSRALAPHWTKSHVGRGKMGQMTNPTNPNAAIRLQLVLRKSSPRTRSLVCSRTARLKRIR